MRKFLVFMLIAVVVFTMAMSGCTNSNDSSNASGDKEMNSPSKPGSMLDSAIDNITGNNNSGDSGSSDNSNNNMPIGNGSSGSASSGSMSSANDNPGSVTGGSYSGNGTNIMDSTKGSFMFNSKLYTLTDESVSSDKIDVQLMSIASGVTGMPSKDGEAMGLDNGTKIYRIKDSQGDKEVAVEKDGKYFIAEQEGANA